MNFFKKVEKSASSNDYQIGVDKFKSFRDIGQKFNYLGIEMIVVSHSKWLPTISTAERIPCLVAEYVGLKKEIVSVYFHLAVLPVLLAENPIKRA